MAGQLHRGLVTQLLHDGSHLLHAGQAGELEAVHLVQVAAVLGVDLFQTLLDGGTDAAVVSSHLADEHGADDGVLIADVGASQIAVALLKAEDEAVDLTGSLEVGNLVTDPLEAGQHIAHLHAVMLCHSVCQRGGHDGLDCHGVLGHGALLDTACADVIQQQNAHLVAGHQLIAAVRALHGDTHAVGVGVGSQHQVCTGLGGQLQTQLQSLEDLGVGVGAGGEVAVGVLLLGHDGDISDAHIIEHMGHGHKAGAVQRAVHQLQTGSLAQTRAHLTCFNGIVQSLFAVIAHKADHAVLHALGEGDVLCAGEHIGLLDLVVDDGGGVIGHLAAVRAVGLVAVVLGRVVGGGDHDTGVAVIVTGSKTQGRHRHQGIIDAHFDAVGCQNACGGLGKDIALQAAVVADRHGLGTALGQHPVCQTLRCLTDNVDVHAVGTGTQHAAQTCGSKLQRHSKAILDLIVIAFDLCQLRLQVCIFQIRCQPALIFIQIHLVHLTFV